MTEKYSKNELRIIEKAFNEVIDEYEANSHIIFESESEKAEKRFGSIREGLKKWSKSQRCMVPGCQRRSIIRSHAVPKGMSISEISEHGHVLQPEFDHKTGKVTVKKVGAANATTFPGFCSDHELLFQEFENKKSITTPSHLYLQTYRAACRELFRADTIVKQQDWTINEYCATREKGIFRLLRRRLRKYGLRDDIDFKSINFEDDPIISGAREKVEVVREHANHIRNVILPALEKAVFHGDDSEICVIAFSVDLEIPVALAGAASFSVDENGSSKRITLLMNVVPSANSTLVIFSARNSDSKYLEEYRKYWQSHALNMVSMIESWMINGTDQWCLTPSVWEKIPEDRKLKILSKILSTEGNIGQHCKISIFDDIRIDLMQQSDEFNKNTVSDAYKKFRLFEQAKMA